MSAVTVWDGTVERDTTLTVWRYDEEHPATAHVVPYGYQNVEDMLAEDVFYIAHRGGSADWPEMSLKAYSESVQRGVGALEVSLNRTSDGVWFGLHDEFLDRTSGVTGNIDPQTLTWAEIQEDYQVLGTDTTTPGQPAQPYMRFEELTDLYGTTHVFFVDPKYRQSSHRTEFLDLVESRIGQERAIIKYFCTATALASAASARGFTTWGYYYSADIPVNLPATASYWDILGLSYYSTQEDWDEILTYGKRVIGHVCEDIDDADDALDKGATGIMAAGVRSIIDDEGI